MKRWAGGCTQEWIDAGFGRWIDARWVHGYRGGSILKICHTVLAGHLLTGVEKGRRSPPPLVSEEIWEAPNIKVLTANKGEARVEIQEWGKLEILEKTCQPVISSIMIPTCENPRVTPRGIETGLVGGGSLTTTLPREEGGAQASSFTKVTLQLGPLGGSVEGLIFQLTQGEAMMLTCHRSPNIQATYRRELRAECQNITSQIQSVTHEQWQGGVWETLGERRGMESVYKAWCGEHRGYPVYLPRLTGFNPGQVALPFSQVGIVPDDAAGRQVFWRISHFPCLCILALLHSHLISLSSALKTSLVKRAEVDMATRHVQEVPVNESKRTTFLVDSFVVATYLGTFFDYGHGTFFDYGHGTFFDYGHGTFFDYGHGTFFDYEHGDFLRLQTWGLSLTTDMGTFFDYRHGDFLKLQTWGLSLTMDMAIFFDYGHDAFLQLRTKLVAFKEGKRIPPQIRKISPFLDPIGLITVGGRLSHPKLPYEQKHPALLPNSYHLTDLIINHYHNLNQHPGIQTFLRVLLCITPPHGVLANASYAAPACPVLPLHFHALRTRSAPCMPTECAFQLLWRWVLGRINGLREGERGTCQLLRTRRLKGVVECVSEDVEAMEIKLSGGSNRNITFLAAYRPPGQGWQAIEMIKERVDRLKDRQWVVVETPMRWIEKGVGSVLDVMLVRPRNAVVGAIVLDGISDHHIPVVEIGIGRMREEQMAERLVWQYGRGDKKGAEIFPERQEGVEVLWREFRGLMEVMLEKFVPMKRLRTGGYPPYYGQEILKMKGKCKKLHAKWRMKG
ncbi:hypothetical protein PR048_033691 [Dryococelus australis]|uniref:Uncharacterized protein n=1 Tax=Dryococelus australis TaxID=614101 RepID=A0ABQ9G110_9NEOP|nr:hypothetical protein PR048_033691 [Dryococelus australis]